MTGAPTPGVGAVAFRRLDQRPDAVLATAAARRRDRLRRVADRNAFTGARVLAAEVAGALLARPVPPGELGQHCSGCGGHDHGRPVLVGGRLSLSWAHTVREDEVWVAALAVAAPDGGATGPVGVDVEFVDARVPTSALSPAEAAAVAAGVPASEFWVGKEALVKAGHGGLDRAAELDVLAARGSPSGLELTGWRPDHGTDEVGAVVGAWAVPTGTRVKLLGWPGTAGSPGGVRA